MMRGYNTHATKYQPLPMETPPQAPTNQPQPTHYQTNTTPGNFRPPATVPQHSTYQKTTQLHTVSYTTGNTTTPNTPSLHNTTATHSINSSITTKSPSTTPDLLTQISTLQSENKALKFTIEEANADASERLLATIAKHEEELQTQTTETQRQRDRASKHLATSTALQAQLTKQSETIKDLESKLHEGQGEHTQQATAYAMLQERHDNSLELHLEAESRLADELDRAKSTITEYKHKNQILGRRITNLTKTTVAAVNSTDSDSDTSTSNEDTTHKTPKPRTTKNTGKQIPTKTRQSTIRYLPAKAKTPAATSKAKHAITAKPKRTPKLTTAPSKPTRKQPPRSTDDTITIDDHEETFKTPTLHYLNETSGTNNKTDHPVPEPPQEDSDDDAHSPPPAKRPNL